MEVAIPNLFKNTGEGPYWDYRTQELSLADISISGDNSKIFRWNPITKYIKSFEFEKTATTFNIPCVQPQLSLVSSSKRIMAVDWTKEDVDHVSQITEVHKDQTDIRFNDGKCDRNGVLFAGTMSEELSPGVLKYPGAGCLWRFDGSEARIADRGIDLSNGIDWTEDGTTLLFADSVPRLIRLYEFDSATSEVVKRRGVIEINKQPTLKGMLPDGLTMDAADKVWIAFFAGACVVQMDIEKEVILQRLELPTKSITSCCFGGPQLSDLYVTSAVIHGGIYENADSDPTAGSLFRFPGSVHGSRGRQMHFFRLPHQS